MTQKDIADFNSYLHACTDAQVRGVFDKEMRAGRKEYALLAAEEAWRRGFGVTDNC